MKYKYDFDWFTPHITAWTELLAEFKGKPDLRFLEIGTHEGRCALWLLENILTEGSCTLTCVDPHSKEGDYGRAFMKNAKENFLHNTLPHRWRLHYLERTSLEAGKVLQTDYFDFVYVDGSHEPHDCLHDCVLAHRALRQGGLCIVDDYTVSHPGVIVGWDAFASAYKGVIDAKKVETQWVFRKL